MGIYSRYTTAFLIILATIASPSVTAATLHPVPSIAKALAAGPSGVMPSGLTVLRSQQLGTMLLKSQVQLAMGGMSIAVNRGATLSVGALARTAVTVLKNSSPPKLIAGAVITGAIAMIPGAKVHEGELILAGEPDELRYYTWQGGTSRYALDGLQSACSGFASSANATYWGKLQPGSTTLRTDCYGEIRGAGGSVLGRTYIGTFTQYVENCPYGVKDNACNPTASLPFSESNWSDLESAIPASDPSPDAVRDFWFDLCGGSPTCLGSFPTNPTLTGPASLPSTQTTTTTSGPLGTTTTTKTTQTDLDYSNPDGVVSRDKTTTTTTNPDGSQSTDITEDTGPVVGAEPKDELEDGTFNDSPFPEVEPFYQQKYPDGLEGVWNTRSAEFKDSAFMDFLGSFVPSFSGSCPAWSINVNIASWANFGVHDFQTLCWVFDFIKVVLLVSAAFLCRALMFGG